MNRPGSFDAEIAASTEFVCECWGVGEETLERFAPVTRDADGTAWIHPTRARDCPRKEIAARATRIWRVSGSFWNVGTLTLIHRRHP